MKAPARRQWTMAGETVRRGAPVSHRPPRWRRVVVALQAGLVAVALVAGCTSRGAAESQGLEARAEEYMDLRQRGSWDAIWNGLIDPEAREGIRRASFMEKRRSSFDIVDFEIVSVDEEGEEGRVVARMDTIVPVIKPGGGLLRVPRELDDSQKWVLRDGRWYIQLRG